jgi:hypothetical protein
VTPPDPLARAVEQARPKVLAKAQTVVRRRAVYSDGLGVWRVRSLTDGDKMYRVQCFDSYLTCTCQHGSHHGGDARCYHAVAVGISAGQH